MSLIDSIGIARSKTKNPIGVNIMCVLTNYDDLVDAAQEACVSVIISGAGLMNALELVGKKMEDVRISVNGAGAAAISCSKLYMALGAKRENIVMLDSKGVLNKNRKDLNKYKKDFVLIEI